MLLPALLVCLTPFTRIIIVLSFVRRAVTAQAIPLFVHLAGLKSLQQPSDTPWHVLVPACVISEFWVIV